MKNADALRESLGVCVAYLCARLEEVEADVLAGRIRVSDTGLRNLVQIGRELAAALEALGEIATPQDLVVRFTDSDCEPQDIV